MNLLIQSMVSKIGSRDGRKRRAIVYDPKSDLGSFIAGAAATGVPIHIMNPLDRRFSPWDIATDISTESDAVEFATVLIPKNDKESTPYFTDVARSIVAGIIKRFINAAPGGGAVRWTLRDLILAAETMESLREVLSSSQTRYLLDHFQPDNARNFAGVKSTLDNTMALYRPIAALSDSASAKPVSIKRWLQEEQSILLLGNRESAREATDTLNRLLIRQFSKFILDRDGQISGDETWLFLDEVREAGALSGLRQLLLRGRSKGVAIAMSFQDVEGMYAAYGQHQACEIIGAAQNLAILHLNPSAPATAEVAAKFFASRREYVSSHSVTVSERASATRNQHADLIPNVLPVQFVELPMPERRQGLHYFAFTNTKGYGKGHYSWRFLEEEGPLRLRNEAFRDLEPQNDSSAFTLNPWDTGDRLRLGLPEIGNAGETKEHSLPKRGTRTLGDIRHVGQDRR